MFDNTFRKLLIAWKSILKFICQQQKQLLQFQFTLVFFYEYEEQNMNQTGFFHKKEINLTKVDYSNLLLWLFVNYDYFVCFVIVPKKSKAKLVFKKIK
jgi:hypothetical protein